MVRLVAGSYTWPNFSRYYDEDIASKTLQQFEPLKDPRWEEFLAVHPQASVFHTPAWLEALRRTYGYAPIAYTTSLQGRDLRDGVVFCRVESWVTGRRLVSLPFSDHCEPLVSDVENRELFLTSLQQLSQTERWRYIELRPRSPFDPAGPIFQPAERFSFHELDLSPDCDTLFRGFHKDSTQRKIRRAAREGLTYQAGSTRSLLGIFYRLMVQTRRRQGVPPQPLSWFRNLIDCFGDSLKIRVAFRGNLAVASILTLSYKDTLVYKYGCSDPQFNSLGGTHLLFWRSIEEAKRCGLTRLDLGRSDLDNQGLITFKDRWGATRSDLTYLRIANSEKSRSVSTSLGADWKLRLAKRVFAHMPTRVLQGVGTVAYKHVG
jgi:CelD/BcsL family acetyltransferase involved in cellulose biosynthesis